MAHKVVILTDAEVNLLLLILPNYMNTDLSERADSLMAKMESAQKREYPVDELDFNLVKALECGDAE